MLYLSLFFSSMLAASIVPFSSEVVLLGLLHQGLSPGWLWVTATAGNTLGSILNWSLGRFLLRYQDRRWFPVTPEQLKKAQAYFQRYGLWTLLLAWVPFIGDTLTLAAGVGHIRLLPFTLLVALGKGARYGVFIWAGEALWPKN